MWLTEEVSLVEFYRSGLRLARDAGYKMVFCLVARHADASGAYDEIVQKWESLDDLTGSNILFLFAGESIRHRYESKNFVSQQHEGNPIVFSENAVLLNSRSERQQRARGTQDLMGHYSLEALRKATSIEKRLDRRRSFGRHQPDRPCGEYLATKHSREISDLRNHLGIQESDVPCIHITFLNDESSVHFPVLEGDSIYRVVKAIVCKIFDSELGEIPAKLVELTKKVSDLSIRRAQLSRELKACLVDPTVLLQEFCGLVEKVDLNMREKDELQSLLVSLKAIVCDPSSANRAQAFMALARLTASDCFEPLLKRRIRSEAQRLIDKASSRPTKAAEVGVPVQDLTALNAELISVSERIAFLDRERKELAARQDREIPTAIRTEISSLFRKAREIERCEHADVFISYSRKDAELANEVHTLLESRGLKVFRDTDIRAPELFRAVIKRKLDAARAVVVIWTASSVDSEFVAYEADRGRQKLVQLIKPGVALSDVPPPFTERQIIPVPRYDLMLDSLRTLGLAFS